MPSRPLSVDTCAPLFFPPHDANCGTLGNDLILFQNQYEHLIIQFQDIAHDPNIHERLVRLVPSRTSECTVIESCEEGRPGRSAVQCGAVQGFPLSKLA